MPQKTRQLSAWGEIELALMAVDEGSATVEQHERLAAAGLTGDKLKEQIRRVQRVQNALPKAGTAADLATLKARSAETAATCAEQRTRIQGELAEMTARLNAQLADVDRQEREAADAVTTMETARKTLQDNAPPHIVEAARAERAAVAQWVAERRGDMESQAECRRAVLADHEAAIQTARHVRESKGHPLYLGRAAETMPLPEFDKLAGELIRQMLPRFGMELRTLESDLAEIERERVEALQQIERDISDYYVSRKELRSAA